MTTETVKVLWFNTLKGFGEAVNDSGEKIFLHYSSAKNNLKIRPGSKLKCLCKYDEHGKKFAYETKRNNK